MTEPEVTPASKYEVVAKPSKVLNYYSETTRVGNAQVHLMMTTMSRTFLLVITDAKPQMNNLSSEASYFTDNNCSLDGLSVAIGEHSTPIIGLDETLGSGTLASRLSKKFNQNRPVYVANNLRVPPDTLDNMEFMTRLFLSVSRFVAANYKPANCSGEDKTQNKTQNSRLLLVV